MLGFSYGLQALATPVAGAVEWWAELVENEPRAFRYKSHYRFVRTDEYVGAKKTLVHAEAA